MDTNILNKQANKDAVTQIYILKISAKIQKSYYNKGLIFRFVKLQTKTLNVTENAFSSVVYYKFC